MIEDTVTNLPNSDTKNQSRREETNNSDLVETFESISEDGRMN